MGVMAKNLPFSWGVFKVAQFNNLTEIYQTDLFTNKHVMFQLNT